MNSPDIRQYGANEYYAFLRDMRLFIKEKKIQEQRGRCFLCACPLSRDKSRPNWAVLHYITPKSRGGGAREDNLQVFCITCTREGGGSGVPKRYDTQSN